MAAVVSTETIEQERACGLHQGTKLHQMRSVRDNRDTPSPTPKLPPSFIHTILDRKMAYYRRFLSQLMLGIPGH